MGKILNYLKIIGIFFGILLVLGFFITLINYFTNISINVLNIISTIVLMLTFFIFGFKQGQISSSKGWLSGLKNGGILCLILLLMSLIFFTTNIKLSTFIYYSILILSSVFGGVIGINRKKENN